MIRQRGKVQIYCVGSHRVSFEVVRYGLTKIGISVVPYNGGLEFYPWQSITSVKFTGDHEFETTAERQMEEIMK